ncbi:methyltransferase [Planococcus sp. A6]|uniref:class I SAM-dependent methyltransferase n=1 Tax=Planococcus sp. A6 TaxID=2992760 RepID=UPI00237B0131|nr:methyltransferase [Planococcus sp. A6]MDE0582924.1 methyltransferase [Planococcus sp. A6]
MSQHYYSKNPQTKSKPQEWTYTLRGETFRFQTDSGVGDEPSVEGPILDVGCGYGPIGMAIAKAFPQRHVHMVDINARAIELAQKNTVLNGVENVSVYESDGLSNVEQQGFGAILTNPPIRAGKETIFRFYEEAYEKLVASGSLWVVIQKKQGAPSTQEKLQELFGDVRVADKKKGYFIFEARKV